MPSIDFDYFRAVQNSIGSYTEREVVIAEEKLRLSRELKTSVCCENALRNGVRQQFIVTATKQMNKCNIVTFPDEPLYAGDYIDCYGEKWIVTEVSPVNTFQLSGTMLLCNFLLKFQTGTPDIIERWAILDSGVYSTTIAGGRPIYYPNTQYKVLLPLDDDTRKLHIDKRFATERVFDQRGDEVLSVFRFTAHDSKSESNGSGAHLLVMKAKSDEFNPAADDVESMVCDYIRSDTDSGNTEGWY